MDNPYFKLNQFWHDMQPRLGVIWDFTGNGQGQVTVSTTHASLKRRFLSM